MKMTMNLLTERIALFYKETKANQGGDTQTIYTQMGNVWAFIQPIGRTKWQNFYLDALKFDFSKTLYRVIIRNLKNVSNFEEKNDSQSRHKKINALGWKHKEFELLFPFAPLGNETNFLESLCIEKGEDYD